MKGIFSIAKNELRNLFFSPLAWVALVVFYVAGTMSYFEREYGFLEAYMRGGFSLRGLEFLTSGVLHKLFYAHNPTDPTVINFLVFIMPMVTMGVLSREFRNGTDKLLFSSPISMKELVLGKFLGLMMFNLMVILTVGMILLNVGLSVNNADWALLVSVMAGLYLFLMLLAAIGIFISSFTSYPAVAGLITIVFFTWGISYFIDFIYYVGANSNFFGDDFVASISYITAYLTIFGNGNGKMVDLLEGVFDSRNFIYFFNYTALFIGCTIVKMHAKRQRVPLGKRFLYYSGLIALFAMVGVISSKSRLLVYEDITREQVHSLAPITKDLLRSMDGAPLEVTYYINVLDRETYSAVYNHNFMPKLRVNDFLLWKPYLAIKPDIELKYVYYYNQAAMEEKIATVYPGMSERQLAEKFAEKIGYAIERIKSPDELKKLIDLEGELYRNVARLRYKGKSSFLRLFPKPPNSFFDPYTPEETEIAPALNRLVSTQPLISFTTGHGELDIYGRGMRGLYSAINYPIFKHSLLNQGLDSDTLSLGSRSMPDSSRVLAICSPMFALTDSYLQAFEGYLDSGRNLFIGIDPDHREMAAPLLEKIGLKARDGVLCHENSRASKSSGEYVTGIVYHPIKSLSPQLKQSMEKQMFYSNDSMRVELCGAVGLELTADRGFMVEPIVILDTLFGGFNRPTARSVAEIQAPLSKLPTDEVKPFTIAYKLTRRIHGKEQRIIVTGSCSPSGANRASPFFSTYGHYIFGWLCNDRYPINLVKPEPLDKSFNFGIGAIKFRKYIWIYGVSAIMIIIGTVVLIKRYRK